MNSLLIVALFFVSISGLSLKKKPVTDPAAFLSAEEIGARETLLELIESLRTDNVNAIAHATDELDSAQSANDDRSAELASASDAEELALGNVVEAENNIANLKTVAAEATAVEAEAKGKKDAAQDASDKAASFLSSETSRIDEEKATLEEVKELLTTLAASAALNQVSSDRKLLSIVDLSSLANADPGSVAVVQSLLSDLIATGEAEREAATDADATASSNLVVATDAHLVTWNALANALGDVDFHTEELADLKVVANAAVAAKNAASSAFNAAVAALGNAQSHFDFEDARVKSEESVFVEVSDLLSSLQ